MTFFKNLGLPSHIDSFRVAFNSVLLMDWAGIFPSWKKKQWNWKLFIPDLVNLANQLSYILGKSPKSKTAKILNLQLQKIKVPKWNQNTSSLYFYCNNPGHWKWAFLVAQLVKNLPAGLPQETRKKSNKSPNSTPKPTREGRNKEPQG